MWVFAHNRVGADFGDRAGEGFFTTAGLQHFVPGCRALNDTHGLMVFECEPKPMFIGVAPRRCRQVALTITSSLL